MHKCRWLFHNDFKLDVSDDAASHVQKFLGNKGIQYSIVYYKTKSMGSHLLGVLQWYERLIDNISS